MKFRLQRLLPWLFVMKSLPWSIFGIFLFSVFYNLAFAQESQIYIDVGQATVKKSLLAHTPLQYVGTQPTNRAHIEVGQELYRVILNDLTVSNYFTMIKPEAYLEDPNTKGLKPAPGMPNGFNFANWKPIGTEFLIRAAYRVIGNELNLEVYVYHVPTTRLVLGKNYKGTLTLARQMAHVFANDLVKALTGRRGMFISKIVASRSMTPASQSDRSKAAKEIFVMDWDGTNQDKITSHNSIAISPNWSNAGDRIAYTAFALHTKEKVRNADLFIFNLATRKRQLISYFKGLNSGAAFLPGDQSILLTLSKDGNPDIYRMSTAGGTAIPMTRGPNRAMNVEPAVSPDGKQVAFSSDRLGRPQIFVMNIDGTNARALTRTGKYNASPAWSPDGKTIAFAGYDRDHFDIFTMSVDGTNLKRLTDATKPNGKAANNESPSWSPDGRQIVFSSDRRGHYQLYLVSPDGTNERELTRDQYIWDKPKWSTFLD